MDADLKHAIHVPGAKVSFLFKKQSDEFSFDEK
jgi:hypothetical protein